MGNSAVVSVAGAADVGADLYVAALHFSNGDGNDSGSESFAVETRIADRIQLMAGEEPSYAIVQIPMASWPDEDAMAVAAVRGGPLDRAKMNTRATISHQAIAGMSVPILTGSVFRIGHDLGADAGVVAVIDDKWLLSKVFCFGQYQYDPIDRQYYFVAADELIFNQGGWPSCIDSPRGFPVFAPSPRYGWKAGDTKEPAVGSATSRARSWRVSDAIKYLRMVHYAVNKRPPIHGLYYGNSLVDDKCITWPASLGSVLAVSSGENRAERTLHDFRLEGLSLLQALALLGRRAGPFELYCAPGSRGGGGDNGNDVAAGPIGQTGLYQSLQAAFDTFASSLNSAFNTSFASINTALNAGSQLSLTAAINNYLDGSGISRDEYTSQFSIAYDKLQAVLAGSDASAYKADARAAYQAYIAELGAQLDGNLKRYADELGGQIATSESRAGSAQTFKALLQGSTEGKSTLSFVSYGRQSGGAKIEHTGISNGDLTTAMASNSVQRGNLGEDIKDYFHEVIVLGDAPCVETLLRTNIDTPSSATLIPAWASADETAWKAYINTNGKNRKAFEEACLLYPLVFAGYSMVTTDVNPDFNPWTKTKWEAQWQFRQRRKQKFRATLLTAINQSEASPANFMPREMPVEYSTNDGVTWLAAQYYNNLQLSYDRTIIMLTALRDNATPQTWKGSLLLPLAIEAADIRLTAVIEADWRLTGTARKGLDANHTEGRVYTEGERVFSYLATTKGGDFIEWLRQGAYPVGQAIPAAVRGTPQAAGTAYDFSDRAQAGKELFTDRTSDSSGRIVEHAIARQRGLRRIKGGGQIVYKQFEPGFLPGARFSGVLDGMDCGSGIVRSVTIEANAQDAILEIE